MSRDHTVAVAVFPRRATGATTYEVAANTGRLAHRTSEHSARTQCFDACRITVIANVAADPAAASATCDVTAALGAAAPGDVSAAFGAAAPDGVTAAVGTASAGATRWGGPGRAPIETVPTADPEGGAYSSGQAASAASRVAGRKARPGRRFVG